MWYQEFDSDVDSDDENRHRWLWPTPTFTPTPTRGKFTMISNLICFVDKHLKQVFF